MMLEQSLISPNFLGKESFRWFIGVTTKYKQIENGGYKAKVRIIGYHPDAASIIKDEELPWAHVLVPLNMGAGEGSTGISFNSRGSETVIGFFMDGDNGQQPVIIGSLFSGYDIEHSNSFNQGTNGFKPFKPDKSLIKNPNNVSSKTGRTPDSGIQNISNNVGVTTSNPKGDPSQGKVATDTGREPKGNDGGTSNQQTVIIPPVCKDSKSKYSKILKALRDFIKTLRTVQQVQDGFVNPALGALQDIPALAKETSTVISDLIIEYIKFQRDQVIADIYKWLKKEIDKLMPKDFKLLTQLAADKVVDSIWCAFNKVVQKMGEFVFNFLMEIIGKVSNLPICAAEAFLGSIMSSVAGGIEDALGPTLQEVSSTIGPILGQVSSYVSKSLNYANQALAFLSCESAQCKEVLNYAMNKGYIPQEAVEGFQNSLNYPRTALSNGKEAARKWLGITGADKDPNKPYAELQQFYGDCDAVNLECGLPNITFFGGGGVGAAGLAVVDSLGQLMGINMTDFGIGYSQAPYVSIEDPCGNGSGAVATANIDSNGSVSSVTINNPGSGYLGVESDSPCTTDPIDQSGSSVIGYIVGVNIIKTGIGYGTTDLITDSVCASDVEIYPVTDPEGRIVSVNIVNPGSAIRVYPRLTINTEDGEGAILEPILNFTPIKTSSVETNMSKIKKVVLCAEDHGR